MNYFVSSWISKRYTGQDSGQRRGVIGQKTAMPCWTEQREFQLQNMIINDSSTNFRNYLLWPIGGGHLWSVRKASGWCEWETTLWWRSEWNPQTNYDQQLTFTTSCRDPFLPPKPLHSFMGQVQDLQRIVNGCKIESCGTHSEDINNVNFNNNN